MATYGEIAARVAKILVNSSPDVAAEVPRLVSEAQKAAERRHIFQAMRGNWLVTTQLNSNESAPGKGAMRNVYSVRSESASYTFMRTAHENPYWVELPVLPVFSPGGGEGITLFQSEVDGRVEWKIFSVTAGSAIDTQLAAVLAGMQIIITGFGSQTYAELLQGIPFRVLSVSVSGTATKAYSIFLETPDATITAPATVYTGLTFTATWGTPVDIHPMAWISETDVLLFYSTQDVDGIPMHVLEPPTDELGNPRFLIYPKSSSAVYNVAIPAVFHLGSSLVDLPGENETSWFTNFADVYLERKAGAEALLLEEDFNKASIWGQRAEEELARLISEDKNQRVKSRTMRVSESVRGTSNPRIPRF